ncbi:hypothetical protein PSTG_19275, partial [Puccinia striiformis f. sp. tritici PST-78]
ILQHAVNKFCGCIEQVDLANQSGTTLEDRFVRAMQLYQALSVTGKKTKKPKKPKKFTHMACYHILCKAEKWKQVRKELARKEKEEAQKSRRSTPFVDSETGTVPSSDLPNDDPTSDASTIQSPQTPRALGTKKAKELAAKLREDKKFKDNMLA